MFLPLFYFLFLIFFTVCPICLFAGVLTLPLLNKSLLQRTLGGVLLFESGPSALDFVKIIFSSCCMLFHPFLSFTCFFLFFCKVFHPGSSLVPFIRNYSISHSGIFLSIYTHLGDNDPAFPAGECRMNEYTPENASLADGND